jgi:AcrR family transcriptional regulator
VPTSAATRARPGGRAEQVLDGLVEIFLEEGFAHLGVAEMAQRLSCSKSTLYAVAPSKEQIVTAAVRHFFKTATERVEASAAAARTKEDRLLGYLQAIAVELTPAGRAFIRDVEGFGPAREIYRRNTEAAADRVRELVESALPATSTTDPHFVGAVAAVVMEAIQRGAIQQSTGLDHAQAYAALGDLLARSRS